VTGSHIFKFKEPLGRYVLTSNQPSVRPATVVLHPGQVAQVNLYPSCK
jgi:hypothetical protein